MMPHLSQPGYDPQIQVKLLEVLRMPIGCHLSFQNAVNFELTSA